MATTITYNRPLLFWVVNIKKCFLVLSIFFVLVIRRSNSGTMEEFVYTSNLRKEELFAKVRVARAAAQNTYASSHKNTDTRHVCQLKRPLLVHWGASVLAWC